MVGHLQAKKMAVAAEGELCLWDFKINHAALVLGTLMFILMSDFP